MPDDRAKPLKIFFDGGCRPNPGAMEYACVAAGVLHHASPGERGDSHQAEWRALLHALRLAATLGASDVILIGDSRAVIGQATAGDHGPYRAEMAALAAPFARLRFRHVGRSQNLAGIALDRINGRR